MGQRHLWEPRDKRTNKHLQYKKIIALWKHPRSVMKLWRSLPRRDDNASLRSQNFNWESQEEKVIHKAERAKCSERVECKCNDRGKQENFQEVET